MVKAPQRDRIDDARIINGPRRRLIPGFSGNDPGCRGAPSAGPTRASVPPGEGDATESVGGRLVVQQPRRLSRSFIGRYRGSARVVSR